MYIQSSSPVTDSFGTTHRYFWGSDMSIQLNESQVPDERILLCPDLQANK